MVGSVLIYSEATEIVDIPPDFHPGCPIPMQPSLVTPPHDESAAQADHKLPIEDQNQTSLDRSLMRAA